MLCFPIVFKKLKIDGLIETDALSGAIPRTDLHKIPRPALHTLSIEGAPPEFQNLVPNGQLESPVATVEMQFEVGDFTVREKFIVITNLTGPLIGLLVLQRKSTKLDVRQ